MRYTRTAAQLSGPLPVLARNRMAIAGAGSIRGHRAGDEGYVGSAGAQRICPRGRLDDAGGRMDCGGFSARRRDDRRAARALGTCARCPDRACRALRGWFDAFRLLGDDLRPGAVSIRQGSTNSKPSTDRLPTSFRSRRYKKVSCSMRSVTEPQTSTRSLHASTSPGHWTRRSWPTRSRP